LKSFLAEGDFSGKPPTVTAAFLRLGACVEQFAECVRRDEPTPGHKLAAERALFDEPVDRRPAKAADRHRGVNAVSEYAVDRRQGSARSQGLGQALRGLRLIRGKIGRLQVTTSVEELVAD
jgi:hypothetical protein